VAFWQRRDLKASPQFGDLSRGTTRRFFMRMPIASFCKILHLFGVEAARNAIRDLGL
jgi:hypothetical protein